MPAERRPQTADLQIRVATEADLPTLRAVMDAAIADLQQAFLEAAQIEASRAVMGLDSQLVTDGTYFVVETHGDIVGCGGWSRRGTLYGGDHSAAQRDPGLLDPAIDPARVRAMYTRPSYARRGVGRLILQTCERAAFDAGFRRAELMATLAGEPLYRAAGYAELERLTITAPDGTVVPLVRMGKPLQIEPQR